MNTKDGGPWQVTYFNTLAERRFVLADNIDEATADAVVARFGYRGEKELQLNEVCKVRAPKDQP